MGEDNEQEIKSPSFLDALIPIIFLVVLLALAIILYGDEGISGPIQVALIMSMLVAGLAMGVSATIAGGCNTGHGLTGVPTLALSSLTATLFTFLGAWVGNYTRWVWPQRQNYRCW